MTTKIWNVKFGDFTSLNVLAPNIKEAMKKALSKRRGEYHAQMMNITEIRLVAEAS